MRPALAGSADASERAGEGSGKGLQRRRCRAGLGTGAVAFIVALSESRASKTRDRSTLASPVAAGVHLAPRRLPPSCGPPLADAGVNPPVLPFRRGRRGRAGAAGPGAPPAPPGSLPLGSALTASATFLGTASPTTSRHRGPPGGPRSRLPGGRDEGDEGTAAAGPVSPPSSREGEPDPVRARPARRRFPEQGSRLAGQPCRRGCSLPSRAPGAEDGGRGSRLAGASGPGERRGRQTGSGGLCLRSPGVSAGGARPAPRRLPRRWRLGGRGQTAASPTGLRRCPAVVLQHLEKPLNDDGRKRSRSDTNDDTPFPLLLQDDWITLDFVLPWKSAVLP
ncbi:uncharacterized protein LOC142360936 [Opisthocomus hoazin]|uniref:uncharacterized protein LOC142360936 n=1 Tax=Opisthocomus hoazin TaxID=30419 RepID=UPI003F53360B